MCRGAKVGGAVAVLAGCPGGVAAEAVAVAGDEVVGPVEEVPQAGDEIQSAKEGQERAGLEEAGDGLGARVDSAFGCDQLDTGAAGLGCNGGERVECGGGVEVDEVDGAGAGEALEAARGGDAEAAVAVKENGVDRCGGHWLDRSGGRWIGRVPSVDGMLILFDIDATLISTSGVGMRALGAAGQELFGAGFTEARTAFAGRLDPVIIADLLRDNGQEPTPEHRRAMRAGYRKHLEKHLDGGAVRRVLPGVPELLGELRGRDGVVLGLLTGNFPETGAIKLRACGIEPEWFEVAVWADDSPHDPPAREHLPAVGIAKYRARKGREIEPSRVTIVGDTPHDVSCALANGCRCLGVATGMFSVEQLLGAGAHRAVVDLSDTAGVVGWLVG